MKSPEQVNDPAKPIPARAELIELRFSELHQVFNSFDPSPFRERDLNVAAADYIVDWAKETPLENLWPSACIWSDPPEHRIWKSSRSPFGNISPLALLQPGGGCASFFGSVASA